MIIDRAAVIKENLKVMNIRVDKLERDMKAIKNRCNALEYNFNNTKNIVDDFKKGLDKLEKNLEKLDKILKEKYGV